jgi:hypothetical protein
MSAIVSTPKNLTGREHSQKNQSFSPCHFLFISKVFTTLTIKKERKKRVAMTKQLKREVFTACLVRVSHGTIAIGAFTVVGAKFNINPKTVAKLWHSTLKMVPGYKAEEPINTEYILDNVPPQAFDSKFAMLEESHSLTMTLCCGR